MRTWVEISKSALRGNFTNLRKITGEDAKILAVVKSNAYGHSLVETARTLQDPGLEKTPEKIWFGVDNVDEAILLRKSDITAPILVLGFTFPERYIEAVKYNIRLTFYGDIPKLSMSDTFPLIHLKIDTGMSRQGILLSKLNGFLRSFPKDQLKNIEGVFTHFANADNLDDRRYPNFQLDNFKKSLSVLRRAGIRPKITHAAATAAFLTMPESHFDMARIGVGLYGLWPSSDFKNRFEFLNLKPALTWKTKIVQIKKIKKGTPVGYGATERVKKSSIIAVLPVGYFDGYSRSLSSIGEVIVAGKKCKILGRISMNLAVVDISRSPKTMVGDTAILIGAQGGKEITCLELAEKTGTISYEIVARINPLLPRIFVD